MDENSEITSYKTLEVKPEDLKAWSSAIGQVDGPYPFLDMVGVALNGVAWIMENGNRIKSSTKNNRKANKKAVRRIIEEALSLLNDLSISTAEKRKSEIKEFKEMKNKTPEDKKNELYWKNQKAHWYKK